VNPKVLVSIAVSPANLAWIQVGGTQPKFTASGSFSDSTSEALTNLTTPAVTWNSSNNSVVTIDPTGQVTAVTPGSVFITATSGGVTSTPVALTVTTSTLSSIAITPAAPSVAAGLTVQFTAVGTYSPDNATQDLTAVVTWGATAGATISATGLATAAKVPGSSTISAALGGVNAPGVTLNVTAAVLQSIAVTPANQSILPGATQNFAAIGTMSDGTTPSLTGSVTWSSGTPTVATITSGGVATAVASGGTLTLFASNPGQWGNAIQVSVTPGSPGRFGVQVQYQGKVVENFVNLSVTSTDPQYVVTVIDSDSQYLSFINPVNNQPVIPTAAPAGTAAASAAPFLAGGVDGAVLTPASDGNFELAMLKAGAGVNLLDRVDIFNLLCVPSESDGPTIQLLQDYCFSKRAFYLVDSPQLATISGLTSSGPVGGNNSGPITAGNANYSAFYFPWVWAPDPLFGNRTRLFPPCGFVAGIYAATDAARGVWKAPAGIGAGLSGESGLQYTLTDQENGDLNTQAINCLRTFKVYGDVVWGARTLQGNDQTGSQWKYVPIRRLALYIESSLYDGTQWAVFEPNDETLWSQVRLDIGAFMQGLFLQGAFQGTTPSQAYFVKCDSENNPQTSISLGILNVLVGFSPLYPAEFVVIEIQQMAGQSQS
jgi:hypothetical protein